ncbi:MAG: helix-turn-helix transcriptional regulator [Proteobacteria bacterium]|nr:helix-turn-helix transcriptional regulator [Pseudomonadota bacterium]
MTPAQCRAARALLGIEQGQVAEAAGIARATLIDFEKEQRIPRAATLSAIRSALEAAGVEFIPENGGGLGVRIRKVGGGR